MNRTLQKIPEDLSNLVRASSTVSALHNAIEELILNSIDAGSSVIEIYIDFGKLDVKIVDNGCGIEEEDLSSFIGEWNRTSKSTSGSYGQKGEALAAIIQMSKSVEVYSRPGRSAFAFKKCVNLLTNCQRDVTEYVDRHCGDFFGTAITVKELFHYFPVRVRATNGDVERSLVKEFVKKMCVLHHNVRWLVVDSTDRDSSFGEDASSWESRVICRFAPQDSVPRSFAAVHGQEALCVMKEVSSHCHGPFTLQGLLSPPIPSHCHWTRRYQYCYLNSRWLKGADAVSQLVNHLYAKTLSSVQTAGMTAKHMSYSVPVTNNAGSSSSSSGSSQRLPKYPHFVLQLLCDEARECDILSEPDKTAITFRRADRLKECVISAVQTMFAQHAPELLPAFSAVVRSSAMCSNVYIDPALACAGSVLGASQPPGAEDEEGDSESDDIADDVGGTPPPLVSTLYRVQSGPVSAHNEAPSCSQSVSTASISQFDLFRYGESGGAAEETRITTDTDSPSTELFKSAFCTAISADSTHSSSSGTAQLQSRFDSAGGPIDLATPVPTRENKAAGRLKRTTIRRRPGTLSRSAASNLFRPVDLSNYGGDASDGDEQQQQQQDHRQWIRTGSQRSAHESVVGATVCRPTGGLSAEAYYDAQLGGVALHSSQHSENTVYAENDQRPLEHQPPAPAVAMQLQFYQEAGSSYDERGSSLGSQSRVFPQFEHTGAVHSACGAGWTHSRAVMDAASALDFRGSPTPFDYEAAVGAADQMPAAGSSVDDSSSSVYQQNTDPQCDHDSSLQPTSEPNNVQSWHSQSYAASTGWGLELVNIPPAPYAPGGIAVSEEMFVDSSPQDCWGADAAVSQTGKGADDFSQAAAARHATPDYSRPEHVLSSSSSSSSFSALRQATLDSFLGVSQPEVSASPTVWTPDERQTATAVTCGRFVSYSLSAPPTVDDDDDDVGDGAETQSSSTPADFFLRSTEGEYGEPGEAGEGVRSKKRQRLLLSAERSELSSDFVPSASSVSELRGTPPRRTQSSTVAAFSPTSTAVTQMSIDKNTLRSGTFVGQCDRKFLLSLVSTGGEDDDGTEGRRTVLLAFDQHAADERVSLERMYAQVEAERASAYVGVEEVLRVSEEEAAVLQQRVALFLAWNFEYHIEPPPSAAMHSGSSSCFVLTVLQVPTVLGEPLGAHDLLEFVHMVTDNAALPDSLLKPPARHRILASKACHGSIRFGDELSRERSENLMASLSETSLPFKCAHGRPSVVPLLDLRDLHRARAREMQIEKERESNKLRSLLACLKL